ncbi:MAG TPA: AgmX/PglI C-terminal domain-containing protein [Kofleriaceae bacterium]|nr:AgmX/PglI C-terminal domain-containing protein [Kofleriaceae bacterium]
MKRVLFVIVIAACGGAKPQPPPAPVSNAGGSAAGSGDTQRRVYDFSGETLARDAKDEPAGAPGEGKTGIRAEIQRHRGTLAACLAQDAAAKGQIDLVFGIAASGVVGDVYVNGVGNDELKACMTAAVKTFAFAADPGGVLTEVHYPFTLP